MEPNSREVWLLIAALCSLEASTTTGKSVLPLRSGVAVAGGAQNVGPAVKAAQTAHPDQVTVQLDFSNAVNTLCRGSMLTAIQQRAPLLAEFATVIYGRASELLVRDAPAHSPQIWSQTRENQGGRCPSVSRYRDLLNRCRRSTRTSG